MRLPLDILDTIAGLSLQHYRLMLILPRFARSTVSSKVIHHNTPPSSSDCIIKNWIHSARFKKQVYWQQHFTITIIKKTEPNKKLARAYMQIARERDAEDITRYGLNGLEHRVQFGPNAGPARIVKNMNKNTVEEQWLTHGILHRENGPAITYSSGEYEWYNNGLLHRVGGPALYSHVNGHNYDKLEEWYHYGMLHRVNGPASINTYLRDSSRGNAITEKWYINGLCHRDHAPAVTKITTPCKSYPNGLVREHKWFNEGAEHRVDGPAVIQYDQNGDISEEHWFCHGKLHRVDGPAIRRYNGSEEWWLHGQRHRDQEGSNAGPAIFYRNGTEEWWFQGVRHRTQQGPNAGPAIIRSGGVEEWWVHGKLHRPLVGPLAGSVYVNPVNRKDTQYMRYKYHKFGAEWYINGRSAHKPHIHKL
jgi:hypothetical protein